MRRQFGVEWISILLIALVALVAGCEGGGYGDEQSVSYFGGIIIGPAEGYHSHIYRDHDNGYRDHNRGGDHDRGGYRDPAPSNGGHDPAPAEHVAGVQVTGTRVHPTDSPVLDQFNLSLHDVQYQRKPFHVVSVGSNVFTAQLKDADVNAYLNQRTRTGNLAMHDIHMTFTSQQVKMTTIISLNNHETTVLTTGTLVSDGPTRVAYAPNSMTADGAPLPAGVQQDILSQLNPVADLGCMNCSPQIKQITLAPGAATITGTAALKNMP